MRIAKTGHSGNASALLWIKGVEEEKKLTTQEWKFTAKDIASKPDLFLSGHRACAGCGPAVNAASDNESHTWTNNCNSSNWLHGNCRVNLPVHFLGATMASYSF